MVGADVRAVEQQKRYSSVLYEAARTVGNARLAAFLRVEPLQLRRWLGGDDIPLEIFLASLDVIADGPFAPRGAPVRVAAIREAGDRHQLPRATGPAPMRDTTDSIADT